MFDWLCGPVHCGLSGWTYDYQTLLTGGFAILAAVLAIGGQVGLHIKNERDRQIDRGNAIALELGSLGGALGVLLDRVAEGRSSGDTAWLIAIDLPNARQLVAESRIMLDAVRPWLPGPDGLLLATLAWRLVQFRVNVDSAETLLTVVQTEFETGKMMLAKPEVIGRVAEGLRMASSLELPARMVEEIKKQHRWLWWSRKPSSRPL